ncbi:MAG: non-homologous end-joining DNA ligase [Negativicutes bacterium]|nr:non-homologous end-joining DNA ligase [Negativicutes bacterium]
MSDPMPVNLEPMLAKPGKLPENYVDYGFEIKWDGLRAIAYIAAGRVTLQSRNRKDITAQYPELAALGQAAGGRSLVLDGEIVAFAPDGRPSFPSLQHRMGRKSASVIEKLSAAIPVSYMIFDILHLDGASLLARPYRDRREVLHAQGLEGDSWRTPLYRGGEGPAMVAASKEIGLEGVVAKRLDSRYEAGKRSGAWIKIKNQHRQELVIAGWIPGGGRRSGKVGAILTGYYDVTAAEAARRGESQRLRFAGKVGTGFSDLTLDRLKEAFAVLECPTSPFAVKPPYPDAVYIEPSLVGEFEFTEWTPHDTLRHPSFKGLRTDKEPTAVIRE